MQHISQHQITGQRKKNGEVIDVATRPFFFNGPYTPWVAAYDIEERKKAETNLRLFESIVINSNDSVMVTDGNPVKSIGIKINYVNGAFERMTGYSRSEIVGRSPEILSGERTDVKVLKRIKKALIDVAPFEGEIINYRKDGSEYWIRISLFSVNDNYGKPTYFVFILKEITRQKELEDSIRKILKKEVPERTRDLQKSLSKEKELVELNKRFITTASHEFRIPLSIISYTQDYLQQNFHKIEEEEVLTQLQKIKKQVDHMTVLLDDVILAGRTELKKIPVTKTSIDLKSWTEKIVEELIQSTGKSHSIDLAWYGHPGIIETDSNLLRKIMNNLLANAIKFSPHTRKVWLSIESTVEGLIVIVKDKGIGIILADQERLFEAFYRGANATAIQGTGLGLSIVKKAVELLGGYIAISSEENEGTVITCELPL